MREDRTVTTAREIRFVLVADDYEAARKLYRDVFGLEVVMDLDGQGGRGVILRAATATIEIVDAEHDRMVDRIEVGAPQENRFRLAVEIDDLVEATAAVTEAGQEPIGEPVTTPWGDRNRRFRDVADGTQLTLYETPGG
jgi:catechol 2,3-dioxygenase-like lactoylglutathione lyase family enzyme